MTGALGGGWAGGHGLPPPSSSVVRLRRYAEPHDLAGGVRRGDTQRMFLGSHVPHVVGNPPSLYPVLRLGSGLVFFAWDGCGHCHAARADFAEAARRMPSLLAEHSVNPDLHAAHDVSGFPTVLVFHRGETQALDDRSADGIQRQAARFLRDRGVASVADLPPVEEFVKGAPDVELRDYHGTVDMDDGGMPAEVADAVAVEADKAATAKLLLQLMDSTRKRAAAGAPRNPTPFSKDAAAAGGSTEDDPTAVEVAGGQALAGGSGGRGGVGAKRGRSRSASATRKGAGKARRVAWA